MTLPPLDLAVEVVDAAGVRTIWHPGDANAGNRPQGLSFNTKRGDGFAEASVTLARRIDRDYVDLNLFDDSTFFGADGSVAYEGRIAAQPRSFDTGHSISVQLAGYMAHARDQPFTEVFVERDLSAWTTPSRSRQATLLTANNSLNDFEVGRDTTNSLPALILKIDGAWASPYAPLTEALYDAGPGSQIASFYMVTEGGAGVASNASFNLFIQGGSTDAAPDVSSADLWAGTNTTVNQAIGPRRYITASFSYATTPGGADGFAGRMFLNNLTLFGNHGITPIGDAQPLGYPASEVIKYIAKKYCPMLNTRGVQATTWPIPHLVFKDPTDPYDAFLAVNAYHLWELGVWENKTLTFGPTDRTDYDWEVRLSDFGVTVNLQGDSTEDLANGIIVDFADVATGSKVTLFPDSTVELQDPSQENPATRHGLQRWTKISLSSPTTGAAAIQIGRAALAEFNAPKAPGTITVTGHVRDRAGHWQPGWKVRAGDMVAITDHPNDSPRLVTETAWNHDSKQLTITVDSSAKRLDAVLDRIGLALTAGGLS